MARTPSRLRDAPWTGDVEVVVADVTDRERLAMALAGVDVAYYLVHSIGSGAAFEEHGPRAAARRSPPPPRRPACGASSTSAG